MPVGYGQTTVIDTADWRLIVPIKPALNLTGSRLKAKMTASFGGPPAAAIDSDDGSISWISDPSTGLTDHLVITVAVADRGGWLTPQLVTVFFDVHRYIEGSPIDEWLGRSWLTVLPATDSPLVAQARPNGFSSLLTSKQPGTVVLPALQTGPQGGKGDPGSAIIMAAGVALSGHRAVRADTQGRAVYASNLTPGDAAAVFGITANGADAAAAVAVTPAGDMQEPSWAWAPGAPVWLGSNGYLVQPAPAVGDLRQLGIALTPTRIIVSLGPPLLRI